MVDTGVGLDGSFDLALEDGDIERYANVEELRKDMSGILWLHANQILPIEPNNQANDLAVLQQRIRGVLSSEPRVVSVKSIDLEIEKNTITGGVTVTTIYDNESVEIPIP
jgi:hypothetical protein